MTGLAITNHDNLSEVIEINRLQKKLQKEGSDFVLAIGNEIYLIDKYIDDDSVKQDYYHFVLIAKDKIGYQALLELSSRAWYRSSILRSKRRVPTEKADVEDVMQWAKGHIVASTACFRAGEMVKTKNGLKEIEKIQPDDFVLNMYGEYERVIEPTSRFYEGKMAELYFTGNYRPLYATENHQLLVVSNNNKTPRWIPINQLRIDKGSSKNICLRPISIPTYNSDIIEKSEYLRPHGHVKYHLPDQLKITPQIMRLFGLFLGDGCLSSGKNPRLSFSFNEEEFPIYWNSFVKEAGEQLGITWSISERLESHKIEITSSSVELFDLFFYLFGEAKANSKFIPDRLRISKELDCELLFGYLLADGYFRTRQAFGSYLSGETVVTSISQILSQDIYDLEEYLGLLPNIRIEKQHTGKDGINHQDAWYISCAGSVLGSVNKLCEYTHEEVVNLIANQAKNNKGKMLEINGIIYRKVYIKSLSFFDTKETVYCLNNTTHSFLCQGIIVHNCLGGELPKLILANQYSEAEEFIRWCIDQFGEKDFYIELQPSDYPEQIQFNRYAVEHWYGKHNLTITTDSHYLDEKDFPIFEAFLRSDEKNKKREVKEYYTYARLMPEEEIYQWMQYAGIPDEVTKKCLDNTIEVGKQIEFFDLAQDPRIPAAPLPHIEKGNWTWLPEYKDLYPTLDWALNEQDPQTHYCILNCLNSLYDRDIWKTEYLERLEEEFSTFKYQSEQLHDNFYKYTNTMQHFINLAWENDCAVGPSRGSASGCLICYLQDVVQCDPLQYGLPFWRFLNKVRTSPLDIDTDFQPSRRAALFEAIRKERGELGLTQVATYRTLTLKAAINSAGRGYRSKEYPTGLDADITTYLSSLIEVKRGFVATLKQTLEGDETTGYSVNHTFINECNEYPGLLEIIEMIEGLIVGSSTHAAAVILFDDHDRLLDHCSLMRAPNGDLCTALDLHTVEEAG